MIVKARDTALAMYRVDEWGHGAPSGVSESAAIPALQPPESPEESSPSEDHWSVLARPSGRGEHLDELLESVWRTDFDLA